MAAIMNQSKDNKKYYLSEEDWSEVKVCPPYEKSKTLAEKAAWDFHKDLPENDRFDLVTINPSLILGPPLTHSEFASGLTISTIMSGKYPGLPKIAIPMVDVRDVAYAHL